MGDSTKQQMEEEGKERGGRVQSLCKTSITSEKKKASRQTPPPLSSHHGDDAPPPHREQPLGSNRASQSVSVGEEYHDNHTEHTPLWGRSYTTAGDSGFSLSCNSRAGGGRGQKACATGSRVKRLCHFNVLT